MIGQRTMLRALVCTAVWLPATLFAQAPVPTPEATSPATAEATTAQLAAASMVDQMIAAPPSLETVWAWLLLKLPPLAVILLLTAGVLFLARLLESRVIRLITRTATRGSHEEKENRAETLKSVLDNLVTTLTIGFAIVAILDLFGVAASTVLGGAAVVGLAVAFGSQALIKDYFTGFILLMEQQYLINDVVTMNGVTGQVEKITLRMTTLRDADGTVHFIPHGQVTMVSNKTHLWARAVIDYPVAKNADVNAAMGELVKLAQEVKDDPNFQGAVLAEPTMLGVESLTDAGVVVRMFVKTKPMQQWPVKRELLKRINSRREALAKTAPSPASAKEVVAPTVQDVRGTEYQEPENE